MKTYQIHYTFWDGIAEAYFSDFDEVKAFSAKEARTDFHENNGPDIKISGVFEVLEDQTLGERE
jgi:hypothetical protein